MNSTPYSKNARKDTFFYIFYFNCFGDKHVDFLLLMCSDSTQEHGGQNSSVGSMLGSQSSLVSRRGFDPPLRRIFPVEQIFPLELMWVLTPLPPKLFQMRGWEYRLRSSLCTHAFHCTDSEDQQKHTQHAPPTKMECCVMWSFWHSAYSMCVHQEPTNHWI